MRRCLPFLSFSVALCSVLALVACEESDEPSDGSNGGQGGEPSSGGSSHDDHDDHSHAGQGGDSSHDHDHDDDLGDACCELGAICHVIGDDVDPEIVKCHQLGHLNDQSACEESYEHCKEICAGANDDPEPHSCR